MIVLFTDFGAADIYAGQLRASILRQLHGEQTVVDLFHDAPSFDVRASAHLLAALSRQFVPGDVCIAVIDPGVGGPRDAVALRADGCWYVGPDNGLLSVVAARAMAAEVFRIGWRPKTLSASFHGRDLFAPVAARLAQGDQRALTPKAHLDIEFGGGDLASVAYIDHYGNAMTGLRGENLGSTEYVTVASQTLSHARVFTDAPADRPFWFINSIGLVEIAWNQASAAQRLSLKVGDAVVVQQ